MTLADPAIEALVGELRAWPGPRISSHRSANQFFHKLSFLADIGMGIEDPGMKAILASSTKGWRKPRIGWRGRATASPSAASCRNRWETGGDRGGRTIPVPMPPSSC